MRAVSKLHKRLHVSQLVTNNLQLYHKASPVYIPNCFPLLLHWLIITLTNWLIIPSFSPLSARYQSTQLSTTVGRLIDRVLWYV